MLQIKVNNCLYPTNEVRGFTVDHSWGGRSSKEFTLNMTASEAATLFIDDVEWYIVTEDQEEIYELVDGERDPVLTEIKTIHNEYDNSEYSVAGPITDNRDGTVTIKMGMPTAQELLDMLLEGLKQ